MVQLTENQIIITVSTSSPAETLAEMQSGIIEMVRNPSMLLDEVRLSCITFTF